MNIPLSISSDYVSTWGVPEGLREVIQNWLDAQDVSGPGSMQYDERKRKLVLRNPGCMTREALLLGVTTKSDGSMRGIFGEGLKLGALALVRAYKTFRVFTNGEVWTASISHHKAYPGRPVLVFDVKKSAGHSPDEVTVEVGDVLAEEFYAAKGSFIGAGFVEPKEIFVSTHRGAILMDPALRGKIFVKGILVQESQKLSYGYNLLNARTDRDRRMVDEWDSQWEMGSMLSEAAKAGKVDLLAMVENGDGDVASVRHMTEARDLIKDAFLRKYGEHQVGVSSVEEATALEHLGISAVPVGSTLAQMLKDAGLDPAKRKGEKLRAVDRYVGRADLTKAERESLTWASVKASCAFDGGALAPIQVAEFKSPDIVGLFLNGNIVLSRGVLQDQFEALATIIHEQAHRMGGDGEHGHVAAMERAWTKLMRSEYTLNNNED